MKWFRWVAAAGFVACVLAANYVTTQYGLVPVLFGLTTTAGTYFAGLSFVLRDSVQDGFGRWAVLAVIAVGAGLSYGVASSQIATASAVAYLVSELSDWAVYTPLRRSGYVRAAVASNIVGAVVDTYLFLWIAGFPVTGEVVAGQLVAKMTVTAAAIAGVMAYRFRRA